MSRHFNPRRLVTGLALATSLSFGVSALAGETIEILRVRVRPAGGNGFYADSGGKYTVKPGASVEFWVEWKSASKLAKPPSLAIDWGFTEADNTSCGSCKLSKSFPAGSHQVTVRMDDWAGSVTKRTFKIEARN